MQDRMCWCVSDARIKDKTPSPDWPITVNTIAGLREYLPKNLIEPGSPGLLMLALEEV